jgi:hypothetical protein
MSVDGIEYLYVETHDLRRSVEFWRQLGFVVGMDLDNACRLDPPGGGTGIFVEQVASDRSLSQHVHLRASVDATTPGPPEAVIEDFAPTHWGSQLGRVRDPDGREYLVQRRAPGPES